MQFMMNAKAEKSLSTSIQLEEADQVFFHYNDLKLGKKMPIYFGGAFPSQIPQFLPKAKADLIPFSSQKLEFLLEFFDIPLESRQAKAMEYTLKLCEMKAEGEFNICITSKESMLDFVRKIFNNSNSNSNSNNNDRFFKVLSTSSLPKSSKLLQNYVIVKQPKQVPSPKMVPCHMLIYPYAVFKCHVQKSKDQVFKISLLGEDGAYVDAIANCHMNTSNWDPNYVGFHVLGFKPGDSPICHFLPSNDLVWIPYSIPNEMENFM